jgi:hypothetical protein
LVIPPLEDGLPVGIEHFEREVATPLLVVVKDVDVLAADDF